MSEERKVLRISSEELGEMVGEILERQLSPLIDEVNSLKASSKSVQPKLEHAIEHIKNCPKCYSDVYRYYDNAEFECNDCGMPFAYPREEIEKPEFVCPNCKSDEFVEREIEE